MIWIKRHYKTSSNKQYLYNDNLAESNVTGNHKLSLVIVGNSFKLRQFKNLTKSALSVT